MNLLKWEEEFKERKASTMPCPAVSLPPGPFDLLAPHNGFLVAGLALLFTIILAPTLCWMRSFFRRLRYLPRGYERQFLLWQGSIASAWQLTSLLLFGLFDLWGVAFVTWQQPEWQPGCPVDPVVTALSAYYQMGNVLPPLLLGSGWLLSVGGVLIGLSERKARKLAGNTTNS
jgi:hypothetical protein